MKARPYLTDPGKPRLFVYTLTDGCAGLFSVTLSFIAAEGYAEKGANREAAVVLSKGVL